jgi:hypothetical protein
VLGGLKAPAGQAPQLRPDSIRNLDAGTKNLRLHIQVAGLWVRHIWLVQSVAGQVLQVCFLKADWFCCTALGPADSGGTTFFQDCVDTCTTTSAAAIQAVQLKAACTVSPVWLYCIKPPTRNLHYKSHETNTWQISCQHRKKQQLP